MKVRDCDFFITEVLAERKREKRNDGISYVLRMQKKNNLENMMTDSVYV